MLPSAIKTIRELILWGYARLMAEKAVGDRKNWLFTLHTFEELNAKPQKWSQILREDVQAELNKCIYCGSSENSLIACIVAKKMCPLAETHNIISACKKCASSKGGKDLIEWWGIERIDEMPRSVMEKYLKILYLCHECNGTLDDYAVTEEGRVDIASLSNVFKNMCDYDRAESWQHLHSEDA